MNTALLIFFFFYAAGPVIYAYLEGAPILDNTFYWVRLIRQNTPLNAYSAPFPAQRINGQWYGVGSNSPIIVGSQDSIMPVPVTPIPVS